MSACDFMCVCYPVYVTVFRNAARHRAAEPTGVGMGTTILIKLLVRIFNGSMNWRIKEIIESFSYDCLY